MIESSPGWPIMAMPSGFEATASRSCCTIFSDRPAGEDVVDLRAGVGGRLLGAVVDDRAEGIALGAADEEADVDVLAPFVAQRLRLSGGRPTPAAPRSTPRPVENFISIFSSHALHGGRSCFLRSRPLRPVFLLSGVLAGGLSVRVRHERCAAPALLQIIRARAPGRSSPARRDRRGRASLRCRSSP